MWSEVLLRAWEESREVDLLGRDSRQVRVVMSRGDALIVGYGSCLFSPEMVRAIKTGNVSTGQDRSRADLRLLGE